MENSLKLDWLSFTYKPDYEILEQTHGSEFDAFLSAFPEFANILSDLYMCSARGSFYQIVQAFNDYIHISYNNDQPERLMGVNVSVSSCGLEWIFNTLNVPFDQDSSTQLLLSLLVSRGCKISRIDLAYDDFSKSFRPSDYGMWFLNHQIVSKCRIMNYCSSYQDVGHTFYLGSRENGKILRIYDKDIQSKGEVDAVRYEFEFHSKHSHDVALYIIEHGRINFAEYLLSVFRVIARPKDSNMSRIPLDPEWGAWIEKLKFNEEFVGIPHYKTHPSLDRLNSWISTISGSLHAACRIMGWQVFTDMIHQAAIPDRYSNLIEKVLSDIPPDYSD